MKKTDRAAIVLIFFFSFLFYLVTLAPTVLWGDSAKLALYTHELYLKFDPYGGHHLHTIIGKLFSYIPIGDFAYRQNLMSAFFGSCTLILLFLMMRNFGIRKISAILAVTGFSLSHTFWLVSVMNESYTLSLFFIASLLWLISILNKALPMKDSDTYYLPKSELILKHKSQNKIFLLYLFAFLFGLSLSNSLIPLFMLPGFLYFFILRENRRFIVRHALLLIIFFIAGNFIFFYIFFSDKSSTINGNFIYNLLNLIKWFTNPVIFLKEFIRYPAYLFYQFPLFGFFIGLIGIKTFFQRNKKLLFFTLIIFVSYILFASNYMLQRKFYILAPTYLVFALYLGFGNDFLYTYLKNKVSRRNFIFSKIFLTLSLTLLPLATYWSLPKLLEKFEIRVIKIRSLPYRNNISFYFFPNKRNEYGARKYAEEVLQYVKTNSIILADFTPGIVLRYLQAVEGMRKDVTVESLDRYLFMKDKSREMILDFIDNNIKTHVIYLADNESFYEIKYLMKKYNVVREGILYRVFERKF